MSIDKKKRKEIKKFVEWFFKKYGKMMTKLAYE